MTGNVIDFTTALVNRVLTRRKCPVAQGSNGGRSARATMAAYESGARWSRSLSDVGISNHLENIIALLFNQLAISSMLRNVCRARVIANERISA